MADEFKGVIDYQNIEQSVEFEFGRGAAAWFEIIVTCFAKIKQRCDEAVIDYPEVVQIKEKLGTLRIYLSGECGDPYVKAYLSQARHEANCSCMTCGNVAYAQDIDGWYSVLCCWCAHDDVRNRSKTVGKKSFNRGLRHDLKCGACGYFGQISRGTSLPLCPACVEGSHDG
jgi:hypothetical protein